MGWATLNQALVSGAISLVCYLVLRLSRWGRVRSFLMPIAGEFTIICALYSLWRLGEKLPWTHAPGAMHRARQIWHLEQWLHLPSEISMQRLIVNHDHVAWLVNAYYATVHVTAMVFFLIWLFLRHRDKYPHWRNGLVGLTASSLFLHFIRVAPPRFITEIPFVDLSIKHGFSVYGPVGTGVSDQYAAMPSLHVGWAAVVSLGVFCSTRSTWRWLFVLHLPITMFVVAATGNHWWLDGVAALLLLWASLAIDTAVRRWWAGAAWPARMRERRGADQVTVG